MVVCGSMLYSGLIRHTLFSMTYVGFEMPLVVSVLINTEYVYKVLYCHCSQSRNLELFLEMKQLFPHPRFTFLLALVQL